MYLENEMITIQVIMDETEKDRDCLLTIFQCSCSDSFTRPAKLRFVCNSEVRKRDRACEITGLPGGRVLIYKSYSSGYCLFGSLGKDSMFCE